MPNIEQTGSTERSSEQPCLNNIESNCGTLYRDNCWRSDWIYDRRPFGALLGAGLGFWINKFTNNAANFLVNKNSKHKLLFFVPPF